MIVGVAFEKPSLRTDWVGKLTERLPDHQVISAEAIDAADVDVLVVGNPLGSTLTAYDRARLIQSTWAGVDRLLVGAPPVPIARMVAPELEAAMTGFVVMAVEMLHRRVPHYLRAQSEERWEPSPAAPPEATRVGVAGFGALGEPVSRRLQSAGFEVVAWAREPRHGGVPVLAGHTGWLDLLAASDIIVNLLPLTSATRAIFDAAAFSAMRPGAAFVNVARGGHVVEEDLLAALSAGHVSEAILDVFSEEPLPSGHPFWAHERVMVLPHVAAFSDPALLADRVAENIRRVAMGKPPRHLVGPAQTA